MWRARPANPMFQSDRLQPGPRYILWTPSYTFLPEVDPGPGYSRVADIPGCQGKTGSQSNVGPEYSRVPVVSSIRSSRAQFGRFTSRGVPIQSSLANYTWVLFLGRPEIVDLLGLGGSGGPKNHSRKWGVLKTQVYL